MSLSDVLIPFSSLVAMFVGPQDSPARRYVEERKWLVCLISACRRGQLRLRDASWCPVPYSDDGVAVAFVSRADLDTWRKTMGLPFEWGESSFEDTPSLSSKPPKGRAGRPPSLKAKQEITRRIVAAMREVAGLPDTSRLPWSAASILEVCRKLEKSHCDVARLYGCIEVSTFSSWLVAPWGSRQPGCNRCFPSSVLPQLTCKFTSADFREVKLKEAKSR